MSLPNEEQRPSGVRPAVSLAEAQALHARLIARDELALSELIELATPWLLGITQTMLSDPDEAEEVVLEVFHTVWGTIGEGPAEPRGLLAWVLRIARNRAIDRLRARARRARKAARLESHSTDDERFVKADEPDEAATPGWHVHRAVHAALVRLPEEQQVVVRLAYVHGLTQAEIAEQLGIPLGTVKTRLRIAFDKLRVTLGPMKDWIV